MSTLTQPVTNDQQNSPASSLTTLRVGALNVKRGGFGSYRRIATDDPPRLPELIQFVKRFKLGVVGLSDTFRWHQIPGIAKKFGFDHTCSIGLGERASVDPRIGVTILSRYPLLQAEPVLIGDRNCLKALIELPNGVCVFVYVVYGDWRNEGIRELEYAALLGHINNEPLAPTLIIGDLNAVWPDEASRMQRIAKRAGNSRLLQRAPLPVGVLLEDLQGRALPVLGDGGFVDAFASSPRPTFRPQIPGVGSQGPGLRLDHILYNDGYWPFGFTDVGTGWSSASDHALVYAAGRV